MTESFEEVVLDLGLAELIPIPGASRNLLNVGGSAGDRTEITVTTGWSNTKTVEASMSVTASVGGSYGAANFSVSATVGFGYSDSTSLSKSTSIKQVYNFRPGYITNYYQWGVHVKDQQILNGQVKLEAKSIAELRELKNKTETGASIVKLTLTRIAPPSGTFTINNVKTGCIMMCHSYGKGNCKMEGAVAGSIYIHLTAEKVDDNLYRFKNKESGYYVSSNRTGQGNLCMSPTKHNGNIFRLAPTGVRDYFRLQSYSSEKYFVHTDNGGNGNMWMYYNKDSNGQNFKFVKSRKSYL